MKEALSVEDTLKLALEALEEAWYHVGTFQPTEKAIDLYDKARAAIKKSLAQPEQEPVAWEQFHEHMAGPFYKAPPQPEKEPVAWGVFEVNLHDMFFTEAEAVEMAQLKGTHAEVRPLYTKEQL